MNRVELLAPAGDLEKLNIAYMYGADACYIGIEIYSLRQRAQNFNNERIKKAVKIAHEVYNKKLYVALNVITNNYDSLEEVIRFLTDIKVDALIVSSLFFIKTIRKYSDIEIHVSTQASLANSYSVNYYNEYKIDRVVLARELNIKEISMIKRNSDVPLEVFIHGGMCSSFSGRCALSHYMTGRDGNLGFCAHSCRWKYKLYNLDKQVINDNKDEYFSIGSKDLCAVRSIKKLVDLGIRSLKIEGRMKSIYYIAIITRTYRLLIDEIYKNGRVSSYNKYQKELDNAINRLTWEGFLEGKPNNLSNLYDFNSEIPNQQFVGLVKEYDYKNKTIIIEHRNYFTNYDSLEIVTPKHIYTNIQNFQIINSNSEVVTSSNHPMEIMKIKLKYFRKMEIFSNCFVRKKNA